ncbi:MAG TPA: outer membrane lipoprotein-sorting protein [Pseudomonadales bacterium]|nr:outer membrane lipoprotein-sorting protein [Pseudomonadales bacterium]
MARRVATHVASGLRGPVLLLCLAAPFASADAELDAVLADPGADAAARGLAVAEAADRADAGFGDSRVAVRMRLHDARGGITERELRILTLEGRDGEGDRSLILFDSPMDQRGTALLTWNHADADDDQWLYLPALKRVKKIAARNRSGPFVGSEFAFEDLTSDEIEAFDWRFVGTEPCALGECFHVERVPVESWSGYSRQDAWYDTEALRLVRVEYHDRKDSHLKTLTASDWQASAEGWWRAGRMEMVNLQTGRRTDLIWGPHEFGTGLEESDFTPTALRRIR